MMLSAEDVLEIIDFVENFETKGIQLAVLGTPVRSGSFLLHSLLDQHPQVLQLSTPFYYYFDWDRSFQTVAPDALVDAFFSKSTLLLPYRPGLGFHRDIVLDFHFETIARLMQLILKRLTQVNRKTFLLLLHFVYGKYHGMDLKKVKVLLLHHHAVPQRASYFAFKSSHQSCINLADLEAEFRGGPQAYREKGDPWAQAVLSDFPDAKFLIPIRRPMAAIHSGIKTYHQETGQPEWGLAVLVYYFCLLGYYELLPFCRGMGEACKLIKFEDLHQHPERIMREVAQFLGIEFEPSLLRSTFGGHDWYIQRREGRFVCGLDPDIPLQDTRWQSAWSPETQAFYATLCSPLYPAFGYALEVDAAYLEKDPSALSCWIPEEEALYQQYPDFLKQLSDQIIAETRSRLPSSRLAEVVETQTALLNQKMEFCVHYPEIRQRLLGYFGEAKQEIIQQPL